MSFDIAFNPPQFLEEYDGVKMRMLVDELERLHSVLTSDADEEGTVYEVTTFNSRVGDILPLQEDYDQFFLTPNEGDAAYLKLDGTNDPVSGSVDFNDLSATTFNGLLATDRVDMDHLLIGLSLGQPVVTVASNGSTITLSLEDGDGIDLRIFFSSGVLTLDTDPTPVSIALTAGDDDDPTLNYVYVLESSGALAVSSSWPAAEHSPVATVLCQSAASAQTDGLYKVHAWTDHAHETNDGHISHINLWIRSRPAGWMSGALAVVTDGAATFDLAVGSGTILQLHPHAWPSFNTSTGSEVMIINDSVTPYLRAGDLTVITADLNGTPLSNKYFNVVVWGVVSESTGDCQLMINLPNGFYTGSSDAQVDVSGTAVYDIPASFAGTGFLIARLTMRLQGTTYTEILNTDIRGKFPSTVAGGGGAGAGVTELIELTDVDTAATTANFFLSTPDGSAGQYSGRAIVADDLPSLIIRHTTSGYNAGSIVVDSSEPGSPSQGDLWFDTTGGDGVVGELSDLSDVGVTTPTNKNALMADGDSWESRALVVADISDFTDASANWNTAYGWGDHASTYELLNAKIIRHTTSGYNAGSIVVDSSEPGSPSQGDLWFDTTAAGGFIGSIVEDLTPQLGATLDANSFNIDMGTNIITDTKVGQWDTSYGWGDHSGLYEAVDAAIVKSDETEIIASVWDFTAAPTKSSLGIAHYITATYASARITVASSAPGSPAKGDIWFDTT